MVKSKSRLRYLNPNVSRAGFGNIAFSYSVDSNPKRSLETYFAFLNHKTRPPTKVVDLTDITVFPLDHLTDLLLYGSESFNGISNNLILNETINFIFKSERFKTLEAYS